MGDHRTAVFGQRHIVAYRFVGDDHTCRVDGCVPRHSLELFGNVDHVPQCRVALVNVGKHFVFVHGAVKRHADGKRHVFCDAVYLGIGKPHDAADIADSLPCRHRAEGHNLRHMILAVFACNIVDDLAAAFVTEIHVKVGHTHAFRIEEPLK